jgi:hypothetical protein
VNIDLSDEAVEYGHQATKALEAAGGDTLVQQAEADPRSRARLVEPVLEQLGAWDLAGEPEAAAALSRAAGWWATPYPVAQRLAGAFVVDEAVPAASVIGLDAPFDVVTLDGRRFTAEARPTSVPVRKNAFVAPLDLTPADGATDVALALVLPCWTLLGMLDRAMALTRAYVLDRQQFGQRLGDFQGVQFQLTDAEVERAGVAELAHYALCSLRLDDALALRLAAVEAAEVVFRICHQLHGAIGFCDETTLSWLSRHSQPLRRLPWGPSGTRQALTTAIGTVGLTGLFS